MTGYILHTLNKHEQELGPFEAQEFAGPAFARQAFDEQEPNPAAPTQDRNNGPWRHWHLRTDEQGIAWLLLDHADSGTNILSSAVINELDAVLDHLEHNKPGGLVLRSAKPGNFCAGADIKEFRTKNAPEEVTARLHAAHAIADRLAAVRFPTVAVIHGHCFGGGLELALCCHYRIAIHGAKFGFPEIQLGLHPGLGGIARATSLIDPIAAMTMMLTGKPVHDGKAKKLGLVDALMPERHVAAAIEAAISGKLARQKPGFKARLLNTGIARQQAAKKMLEQAAEHASPSHYPAPGALVNLWEKHGDDGKAMRTDEITSFAGLLTSNTARNLIRVFFLREKMKSLANTKHMNIPDKFQRVHVIGAGAMGGDIAAWCALEGMTVTLFDNHPEAIARAVKNTLELCAHKHLGEAEARQVLDRLIPDLNNDGLRTADLVIEAVPEKIEIKRKVYEEVEPHLKPGAILATNTSSIPLQQLTESLQEPGRLVGLHFFNPVAKMQLVEVVSHERISQETLAKALAFTGQINRLPAPVTSAPGFLVNRALTPYLLEAMILLDEGVAAEAIDKAAIDFGMPVGPIELADQVGLDICLGVADMLRERLSGEQAEIPAWLRKKVEEGELGKKSGRGLYIWKEGKAQKQQEVPSAPDGTANRLILPMLNACMACLREGVITDEELLDGAMVFGTGFAPFRGGPMNYARALGFARIASELHTLTQQHGARFIADPGWAQET